MKSSSLNRDTTDIWALILGVGLVMLIAKALYHYLAGFSERWKNGNIGWAEVTVLFYVAVLIFFLFEFIMSKQFDTN